MNRRSFLAFLGALPFAPGLKERYWAKKGEQLASAVDQDAVIRARYWDERLQFERDWFMTNRFWDTVDDSR